MLSATELRIGNLVNYDTAEGDILPNIIDWQDLKWLSEDEKGFNLVHNPIPLTEEWLLKFGATTFDGNFIIERFRLIYKPNYKYYYVVDKYSNVYYSKVEFVHEWQNLFHSMNGKELTLIK